MIERVPANYAPFVSINHVTRTLAGAILFILLIDKRIRHACNVVADNARQRLMGGFLPVVTRQVVGLLHPVGEEFSDDAFGVFFFSFQNDEGFGR